jgi:hypothetical protein
MKASLLRLAAVAATALGLSVLVGAPSVNANPSVGGDNSIPAYVGTGGLLLPESCSGSS